MPLPHVLAFIALAQAPASLPHEWDLVREYAVRERGDGSRYVADELLIGLDSNIDRARLVAELGALGASIIGEYPALSAMRILLPADMDPVVAADPFARMTGVIYAEPNDVGEGGWLGSTTDTHFASQWHLENTGQTGGTGGADIEALAAWAQLQPPQPIVLAILDTGIDFTHPEFIGRVVPGWDYVNEDSDATADHSHGISCAGLAAANTNNGFGVAGVDASATIYPLKVLNASNGGNVTDLVQALNHCAVNGIDVVSMSLINYGSGQTLENGLIAARAAGCILVACGGNGGIGNADVTGPGQSSQVMSIGWTTSLDRRSGGSGTGMKLDFVAPGSGVRTTSTSHSNTFSSFSGCSAATPVAAGIVAMLLGQDPSLTQAEVEELLKAGAEDQVGLASEDTPGRDNFMGWGRLNARRSVAAMTRCVPPTNYGIGKVTSTGSLPTISWSGTPRLAWNHFNLIVDGAVPVTFGIVFHGSTQAALPWMGGTLLAGGTLVRVSVQAFDDAGHSRWIFPIDTGLTGTQRFFQGWFRDSAHVDGTAVGMTNGLAVTFCP